LLLQAHQGLVINFSICPTVRGSGLLHNLRQRGVMAVMSGWKNMVG
jgi:hypothetical protein